VPTVLAAPARFSMMTFWPRAAVNSGARMRVMMSVPPPGAKSTMIFIGRSG
jgi:hypothetical protein